MELRDQVLDRDTLGRFRNWLIKHDLQEKLLAQARELMQVRGQVHTIRGNSANVSDVTMVPELLTDEDRGVYGDSGYMGDRKREDATVHNNQGKQIRYKIKCRPSQSKCVSVRARVQIKRRERDSCASRGGTCLCCSQESVPLPKNTLLRSTKPDCKTDYHVRFGKPDLG